MKPAKVIKILPAISALFVLIFVISGCASAPPSPLAPLPDKTLPSKEVAAIVEPVQQLYIRGGTTSDGIRTTSESVPQEVLLNPSAGLAAGKIEHREVESTGSGSTIATATQAALKSCIEQVCGVNISAETRLDVVEATLGKNDSVDATSSNKLQQRIETATKGRVQSYRVLSTNKNARTGVEVKISAVIAIYTRGPGAGRIRLAFMSFRPSRPSFESDGKMLEGADIAAQFVQVLAQNIDSTGKFVLLDRKYVGEVAGEQQLIASSSASGDDLAKLGNILGADYIVCGSIDDFESHRDPIYQGPSYFKGQVTTITRRRGGMTVGIRIIDVATSQIKFIDTFDVKDFIDDNVQSPVVELSRQIASKAGPAICGTLK